MARIEIDSAGAIGIIRDIPAHRLPPEAWSDGRNVRFQDGTVHKFTGHQDVFGALSGVPIWSMAVIDPSTVYWMYASLTKMFATDGTTHSDITRAAGGDYATTLNRLWNGGILGGIAIITNGADPVQMWTPVGMGTDLQPLTNWPATDRCLCIRPFGQFLVAVHIIRSGQALPHRIKWSHPAAPGSVPDSWDPADPSKLTGERDLSDSEAGVIVSAMGLKDTFIIYKERSTWGMQFVGGQAIMRTFPIFDGQGILGTHCVTTFNKGSKHLVATGEDLVVHNGQESESVLDQRWLTWVNKNIDQQYARRSYVVENRTGHEVWFCFPEVGASAPTLALVWDYRLNTLGVRELVGGISHIALGPIPGPGGGTWDSDTAVWDSDTSMWDEQAFVGYQAKMLQSNKNTSKLQLLNQTEQFSGNNMNCYIQREGLAMIGKDRLGKPKADFSVRKLVKRIWPKMIGGPVDIRLGSQENWKDPVKWSNARTFNPSNRQFIDIEANGRFIAVRFESNQNSPWELHGYDLEMEILGQH